MAGASVIAAVANALRRPRFSVRVRRRRRELRGGAARSRCGPRGDGGHRGLGSRRTRSDDADRAGAGRRRSGRRGSTSASRGSRRRRNVSYAMFSGGGLGWAEAAMKRGEFASSIRRRPARCRISPACRAGSRKSRRRTGVILSVLIVPTRRRRSGGVSRLIEEVVALTERSPDAGRPVPSQGPTLRWPPAGFELEARAAGGGSLLLRRVVVLLYTLFVYLIMRFGISVGGFVPQTYMAQVVGEFRLPQIRRRPADDPGLHARARRCAGAAAGAAAASRASRATACSGRTRR